MTKQLIKAESPHFNIDWFLFFVVQKQNYNNFVIVQTLTELTVFLRFKTW